MMFYVYKSQIKTKYGTPLLAHSSPNRTSFYGKYSNELHSFVPPVQSFTVKTSHAMLTA